jgi:hypothetical protein
VHATLTGVQRSWKVTYAKRYALPFLVGKPESHHSLIFTHGLD